MKCLVYLGGKVGVDLFSVDGKNYMVTVDYCSNFGELDKLNS